MNIKKLKQEMQMTSKIRVGRIKASIRGDFTGDNNLEFWKKRNGSIEIKWKSRIAVKSVERKKCDLGHFHDVAKEETWIWDYAVLTEQEVGEIRDFLT